MNKDEETDANDLALEVEIDRTRQKIRRDLTKFKKIKTLASRFSFIFIVFTHENN